MNPLDKLIAQFEQFPGIGARQARRFAFHVLNLPTETTNELAELITTIHNTVTECIHCKRYFAKSSDQEVMCSICADPRRDNTKLLIVERDSDIQSIERSGVYNGFYFVLGGTVPLLDAKQSQKIRGSSLKKIVAERLSNGLAEIILAFSVNPDGENTERYIRTLLQENIENELLKVSHLGRGLSTGSELEYADPETLKNALRNRE